MQPADPLQPCEPPVRFLADAMLGKLARRLRMLGFDTTYPGGNGPDQLDDKALLARAEAEGRRLLTRDKLLAGREAALKLEVDDVEGQLIELAAKLGHPFLEALRESQPRCSLCNGELSVHRAPGQVTTNDEQIPLLDDAAWAGLPQGVRASQRDFWRCRRCGHLYWKGTHWQQLEATRRELMRLPKR